MSMSAPKAPEVADLVLEQEKRRQMRLMTATIGRHVTEVVRVIELRTGEPIFVWFFAERKDPRTGDKIVALVLLAEPKRQLAKLAECVFQEGVYRSSDGSNFVESLADGNFNF